MVLQADSYLDAGCLQQETKSASKHTEGSGRSSALSLTLSSVWPCPVSNSRHSHGGNSPISVVFHSSGRKTKLPAEKRKMTKTEQPLDSVDERRSEKSDEAVRGSRSRTEHNDGDDASERRPSRVESIGKKLFRGPCRDGKWMDGEISIGWSSVYAPVDFVLNRTSNLAFDVIKRGWPTR